jgi:hypothetical protein
MVQQMLHFSSEVCVGGNQKLKHIYLWVVAYSQQQQQQQQQVQLIGNNCPTLAKMAGSAGTIPVDNFL